MEYTKLGRSGLTVSRIALGCMSFGDGRRATWALDEDRAEPIFRQAVELGITFWDTANVYGYGTSEEIVGRAIRRYTSRDQVVLATKLSNAMPEGGPGAQGTSRKAVMQQVDNSLRRLDTDHIDLYQVHRFDPETPFEETMEALHDVVKAGKVRYLGASSMWAWQFATMQYTARQHGWTEFISMQDEYNLLHREEEREMFGLLAHLGVGSMPWSPLAGGMVARPWGVAGTQRSDSSGGTDQFGRPLFTDGDEQVVAAVERIATERGVSMATVAMAWVLRNPVVDAPIVGATKPHHLADAVAALDLELGEDEVAALEEHYVTRQPTYFR